MNKITITAEPPVKVTAIERAILKKTCNKALLKFGGQEPLEVQITLCDNAFIQAVNADARGIDKPTDVLSFPNLDIKKGQAPKDCAEKQDKEDGRIYLGDILLSLEQAVLQAEKYGHSSERELAFLTVHSVLHLLGFDHELGQEDEREMFTLQEELLIEMGITK